MIFIHKETLKGQALYNNINVILIFDDHLLQSNSVCL